MKRSFNKVFVAWVILISASVTGVYADGEEKLFFSKAYMTSAVISPKGTSIASIVNTEHGQELNISYEDKRPTRTLLNLSEFTPDNAYIGRLAWLDEQTLSTQFVEIKKGVEGLVDTQAVKFLLVIQIPKNAEDDPVIKSVRTKGQLVNPLGDENDAFLYAKSGLYSKVYKVKPSLLTPHKKRLNKLSKKDGGQFRKKNEVVSIKGYAVRWFFNSGGEIKGVLSFNAEGSLSLSNVGKDGEFNPLKSWDTSRWDNNGTDKKLIPIAIAEDENTFYCLDYNEQEVRSVYKVNFVKDSETLVYESSEYEIVNLITSENSSEVVGVKVMKNGELINHYTSTFDLGKQDRPDSSKSLSSKISETADGRLSLVFSESFNHPGQFILIDNKTQSKRIIGSTFPPIKNPLKTKQLEGQVQVDGLIIPYLINIPNTARKKKFPLIVYPHGGPIGPFDTKYYDASVQYFNAKGFAVLRVNFRGSGGHSIELKHAGTNQWGNLMLKDIREATRAVIKRADIDSDKVCIFGISYGGYAATMLTITDPSLFQCGVSMAGVSDVNLFLNSPYPSKVQDQWLKDNVGDTVADYDLIKSISPAYQIDKLERPLLIMHGDEDRVVDVEHAYRLKLMLDKYRKNYEWKIFENQGHSSDTVEQMQVLYKTATQFIRKHIHSK